MNRSLSPVFLWIAITALCGTEFRQNQWEALLVMFAALELVPRGLRLLDLPQQDWYALAPVGLCAAYLYPNFWYLALPYWLWSVWLTLQSASELVFVKKSSLLGLVRVFAVGYWATGASFALMYLLDIQPLGFDPVIVSLTAAHFHVAGFVIAVIVYALLKTNPSPAHTALAWASLLGMPIVAAGITLSKLGYPTIIEQVAAIGFAVFALILLFQQAKSAFHAPYPPIARYAWMGATVCLLGGIALAGLYALRFQIPIDWVNIPNMKYWHGTLNTLGFAWLSLVAWNAASSPKNMN